MVGVLGRVMRSSFSSIWSGVSGDGGEGESVGVVLEEMFKGEMGETSGIVGR